MCWHSHLQQHHHYTWNCHHQSSFSMTILRLHWEKRSYLRSQSINGPIINNNPQTSLRTGIIYLHPQSINQLTNQSIMITIRRQVWERESLLHLSPPSPTPPPPPACQSAGSWSIFYMSTFKYKRHIRAICQSAGKPYILLTPILPPSPPKTLPRHPHDPHDLLKWVWQKTHEIQTQGLLLTLHDLL